MNFINHDDKHLEEFTQEALSQKQRPDYILNNNGKQTNGVSWQETSFAFQNLQAGQNMYMLCQEAIPVTGDKTLEVLAIWKLDREEAPYRVFLHVSPKECYVCDCTVDMAMVLLHHYYFQQVLPDVSQWHHELAE